MDTFKYMEPDELFQELDKENRRLMIIDVRDEDYDEGGHIPGAFNLPSSSFKKHIPTLLAQFQWEHSMDPSFHSFDTLTTSSEHQPICVSRNVEDLKSTTDLKGSIPIFVFHCMQSRIRAPMCARLFLKALQQENIERMKQDLEPFTLPSVYVLSGGFSKWTSRYGASYTVHGEFQ